MAYFIFLTDGMLLIQLISLHFKAFCEKLLQKYGNSHRFSTCCDAMFPLWEHLPEGLKSRVTVPLGPPPPRDWMSDNGCPQEGINTTKQTPHIKNAE